MEIRWGIIGCGDVTEVKSGPGFQQVPGSRLVAVMRRDAVKADDYARRHEVPFWTDNADEVIHHPEVNAVYIATPPGSHLDYALKVAAAGKPCYVEKPMARNDTECTAMVEAFEQANLPLFVAYYRRALPRFLKARELIESGRLGKITSVLYRFAGSSHRQLQRNALPWRWQAEESGGGQFLDLGCHTLDILDFMLGPLRKVEGRAVNCATDCDVEDSVTLHFAFAAATASDTSEGLGSAHWNFASDAHEDLIEIFGTDGKLSLSTFSNEPVKLQYNQTTESFDLPNPRHIQGPFIATMVNHLNGKGECASTGKTAARTSQVIDRVLKSYYGGRNDDFWNRADTWPGRTVSGSEERSADSGN